VSELQRLLNDPRFRPADKVKRETSAAPEAGLGSVLRVVSSGDGQGDGGTGQAPPQDWDTLIHRVQAAARQAREIEAQAREREERIEQVLERVREDVNASNERARVAEAQIRDAQVRAEAQVIAAEERAKGAEARARAAEDRARAAEERARNAEEWLGRVQDAILAEFSDLTDQAAA
jgi:membrane protein involved in colicin uptake